MASDYVIHRTKFEFPLDRYFYGQTFVISGLINNSGLENVVSTFSRHLSPANCAKNNARNLCCLNQEVSEKLYGTNLLINETFPKNMFFLREYVKNTETPDFSEFCETDLLYSEAEMDPLFSYLYDKFEAGQTGTLVLHHFGSDYDNFTALKKAMGDKLNIVMYLHCLADLHLGKSDKRTPKKEKNRYKFVEFCEEADVKYVAVSHAVKKSFENMRLLNEDEATVINNGVSPEHYSPVSPERKLKFRKNLGINADHLVGYVGRLDSAIKGSDNLREVLRRYNQHNKNSVGFIISSSNGKNLREFVQYARDNLTNLIKSNKLKFCIDVSKLMTGFRETDRHILNTYTHFLEEQELSGDHSYGDIITKPIHPYLDVYLHPSRSEALSLSVIEALMSSVPVVASKVGGIPEIVNYLNGHLVELRESPKQNAGGFIKGIENIVNGFAKCVKLKSEIREGLIESGYTDQNMAQEFDEFIEKL